MYLPRYYRFVVTATVVSVILIETMVTMVQYIFVKGGTADIVIYKLPRDVLSKQLIVMFHK